MSRSIFAALLFFSVLSFAQQVQVPPSSGANHGTSQLPLVNNMDVPFYPPLGRTANVHGLVRLQVDTDGERVTEVKVLEGHKVLAEAAAKNLRTWKFHPGKPTSFTVSFMFNFAASDAKNYEKLIRIWPNSEIRTELPTNVEITCAPWPNQGDPSPDAR